MTISGSVGANGKNNPSDVAHILELLIRHRQWSMIDLRATLFRHRQWSAIDLRATQAPQVNLAYVAAITNFQHSACALKNPDGRVNPNDFTFNQLSKKMIFRPRHRVFWYSCWSPGPNLVLADYKAAAASLGCEVAAIQAVSEVETRRQSHDELGRPTILYERHKFREFTNNIYNGTHPDLSGSQGNYGRFSEQYDKLKRAAVLNEGAALKSCSWGAFQIMGFNHNAAGFPTAAAMVDAMIGSQSAQLAAFVSFIKAHPNLLRAIRNLEWKKFAEGYNGPGYAQNNYDKKMDNAYARFAAQNAK